MVSQTGKELDSLAIGGCVDHLGYDVKRKGLYASCGVGQVDTYQLSTTDTAVMAKTALYSPDLDELFAAVPPFGRDDV